MINDKIEAILERIEAYQWPEDEEPIVDATTLYSAKQALLTLIEDIVNDVIGEDEYTLSLVALLDVAITTEDLDRERAKQAQNQLREQQRANFKKVMGK